MLMSKSFIFIFFAFSRLRETTRTSQRDCQHVPEGTGCWHLRGGFLNDLVSGPARHQAVSQHSCEKIIRKQKDFVESLLLSVLPDCTASSILKIHFAMQEDPFGPGAEHANLIIVDGLLRLPNYPSS